MQLYNFINLIIYPEFHINRHEAELVNVNTFSGVKK